MGNMFPTGKEIVVLLIIVSIIGWAVIAGLIKLVGWLFSHVMINFI